MESNDRVARPSSFGANRRNYDKLIKLVFIGDSAVGKTCLLMRFSDNKFPEDHMPTIGIDFKIKVITVDDLRYKL